MYIYITTYAYYTIMRICWSNYVHTTNTEYMQNELVHIIAKGPFSAAAWKVTEAIIYQQKSNWIKLIKLAKIN